MLAAIRGVRLAAAGWTHARNLRVSHFRVDASPRSQRWVAVYTSSHESLNQQGGEAARPVRPLAYHLMS